MAFKDIDERNAQYLLNKIKGSKKALECNKESIFKYYNEKLASGVKKTTLVNYLKVLSRVVEFVDRPFKEVPKERLVVFFNELKPLKMKLQTPNNVFDYDVREYSPHSITRYKTNLKTFWKWLFEGDLKAVRDIDGVPLAVSWIKCNYRKLPNKRPKDVLSREEVTGLIKVCHHVRNKALIAILFETGMRAGELLGMKLSEIEFFDDYCEFVVDGKTGKRPVVLVKSYPFFKKWVDWLKRNKHRINKKQQNSVWVTINNFKDDGGSVLTKGGLLNMLKYAAQKAGIKKRVWTHGFRHSSATDFAKQGYNETELRLKYGWTETSSIPANYTHYKHNELKNKILGRSGKKVSEPEPDGEVLKLKECPFCGNENPFDSSFCGKCAKPIDAKMIKEVERQSKALNTMQEMITKLNSLENKGFDLQQFNRFMESWAKTNGK